MAAGTAGSVVAVVVAGWRTSSRSRSGSGCRWLDWLRCLGI